MSKFSTSFLEFSTKLLVSASLMNWTCVVYGVPMLFVIIWWIFDAHKWFKGPKVIVSNFRLPVRKANAKAGQH